MQLTFCITCIVRISLVLLVTFCSHCTRNLVFVLYISNINLVRVPVLTFGIESFSPELNSNNADYVTAAGRDYTHTYR